MEKNKIYDSAGEVELIYNTLNKLHMDSVAVKNSGIVYEAFKGIFDKRKINHSERFYAFFLNGGNKIVGYSLISIGGLNSTIVDLRIIFQNALLLNASGFCVAHNHPSGRLTASVEDIALTKRIKEAGIVMNIKLIDHLIIVEDDYYSFSDNGYI